MSTEDKASIVWGIASRVTQGGHGESTSSLHIVPTGPYESGPLPPIFQTEEKARAFVAAHKNELACGATVVKLILL